MTMWDSIKKYLIGAGIAFLLMFGVATYLSLTSENEKLKEAQPNILVEDVEALPPGATNLKGLGNRWIIFDLEVGGQKKTFLFKKGSWDRNAKGFHVDTITQIK